MKLVPTRLRGAYRKTLAIGLTAGGEAGHANEPILLAKSASCLGSEALSSFPVRRSPVSLSPQPLRAHARRHSSDRALPALRRGNPNVLLRHPVGAVFENTDFADLYHARPACLFALAPGRVTIMQFRDGLERDDITSVIP